MGPGKKARQSKIKSGHPYTYWMLIIIGADHKLIMRYRWGKSPALDLALVKALFAISAPFARREIEVKMVIMGIIRLRPQNCAKYSACAFMYFAQK